MPECPKVTGGDCSLWMGEMTSEFWLSGSRLGDHFSDCQRKGEFSGLRDIMTNSSQFCAQWSGDTDVLYMNSFQCRGFSHFALCETLERGQVREGTLSQHPLD